MTYTVRNCRPRSGCFLNAWNPEQFPNSITTCKQTVVIFLPQDWRMQILTSNTLLLPRPCETSTSFSRLESQPIYRSDSANHLRSVFFRCSASSIICTLQAQSCPMRGCRPRLAYVSCSGRVRQTGLDDLMPQQSNKALAVQEHQRRLQALCCG